jgi:hypothetical protein
MLLVKRLSGEGLYLLSYVRNASLTKHVMDNIMMIVVLYVLRFLIGRKKT